MPVLFNSHSNLVHEKDHHSFVDEIACGRWAIFTSPEIFMGYIFYWMFDCNAIKEIIEYDGSIHQLKRWTQELLAYEFVIIHRVATMMKDVDSISRCVDPLVHQYNMTDVRLHSEDVTKRPFAYSYDVFTRCTNPRHITASDALSISITTASITSISALYYSPINFLRYFLSTYTLLFFYLTTVLVSRPFPSFLLRTLSGYLLIPLLIISHQYYLLKGTIPSSISSANSINFIFQYQPYYLLLLSFSILNFINSLLFSSISYH